MPTTSNATPSCPSLSTKLDLTNTDPGVYTPPLLDAGRRHDHEGSAHPSNRHAPHGKDADWIHRDGVSVPESDSGTNGCRSLLREAEYDYAPYQSLKARGVSIGGRGQRTKHGCMHVEACGSTHHEHGLQYCTHRRIT